MTKHFHIFRFIHIPFSMFQKVQQAAAMGKAMQIGTQLLSKDGTIGIVTANNTVSLSHPGLYNRGG